MLLAGVVAPPPSYQIVAQRFDRLSAPRSPPGVVATGNSWPIFVVGTVNVAEHSLILWNGDFSGFPQGSMVGRWLDRTGHPLTDRRGKTLDARLTALESAVAAFEP